jgi:hypothetical protein
MESPEDGICNSVGSHENAAGPKNTHYFPY